MAIYQTNLWVCEVCAKVEPTWDEVGCYHAPVVVPPSIGWGWLGPIGAEKLHCPECLAKANEVDDVT